MQTQATFKIFLRRKDGDPLYAETITLLFPESAYEEISNASASDVVRGMIQRDEVLNAYVLGNTSIHQDLFVGWEVHLEQKGLVP